MPKASLAAITGYCDKILRTNEIGDYDGAVNGLQAGTSGVHAHRGGSGRQPRHRETRHCRQRGFVDCASRIVLVAGASVDGQKIRTDPAAGRK